MRALPVLASLAMVSSCEGPAVEPVPTMVITSEWEMAPPELPEDGVRIEPGSSIQAAVEAGAEGDVFVVGAGVHRLQHVVPKSRQRFVGEPGAVLSGAVLLDDFIESEGHWVHEGIEAEGEERGRCRDDFPACRLPEDLFVDDQVVDRVLTLDDVSDRSWYLDHATDRVYLGFDPAGSSVELSVAPVAFGGEAEEVVIEGLVIEKYASPGQFGALAVGRHWTIDNCEIRFNHGTGVKSATGLSLTDSFIHHNGQFAISGGGLGVLIEGNELAHNGVAGYSPFWAAGATKFVHVTDLVVRDNFVHSNLGAGLWTDGGDENSLYEANRVVNNEHAGIKHEISGSAVIRENHVESNGHGNDVELRGAGILIRESGPVEVVENTLVGNADAVVLLHDDGRHNEFGRRLNGIVVTGNEIAPDGGAVGFVGDIDEEMVAGLRFEANRYFGPEEELVFLVRGDSLEYGDWLALGQDAGSSVADRADLTSG